MFKKITVEGFRGITHLEIDDFKRVNLFVGRNNCGKTSILECLFLLTAPTNISLPAVRINAFRGFNHIDEHSWKILFNKLDINTNIEISSELSKTLERRHLLIKADIELISEPITIGKKIHNDVSYSGTGPVIDNLILEYSVTKKSGGKTEKYISKVSRKNQELQYTLSKDYKEIANGVFLRPENNYIDMSVLLDSIQRKKRTQGIITILQQIEPSLLNLSLGANGIIYCDIGLEELVPINIMGDGISRLLSIILTISEMSNGVVLIDEIENGLHYTSQQILWKAIFKAAQDFNVQIFATTHSIECVSAFSEVYSSLDSKDNIRLFRIERENNSFDVVSYDSKVLKSSLDGDWEVR